MKRFSKLIFKISALIIVVVISLGLCLTPFEEGNWSNIDPDTRGITRVNVRFICQDQILNGQLYPPGPPFYIHIYGKCHPTDCDWGEVGAQQAGEFVYATYDQGFAKRYVYIKKSKYRPNTLWMYMYTDFTDPNREDYSMQQWFRK
ncbi:MAG: hypothetical protein KAR57_00845 [Bacteroidales bacterium]|nr:hypothetical protein [Bacteroidales bacterium]